MGIKRTLLQRLWRRLVCVFRGHKPIKWDTSWDNYGSYIVICDRCRKVLEREWGNG
jgi:hypothetical protein